MGNQFKGRFFPELLLDPAHYVRWVSEITSMVGFSGLLLGLLGVMLFKKPHQRALIIGFWVGYIIYGFLFPYHFITHNYYHLPLIPLVAICLAPAADGLFRYIVSLDLHGLLKLGIFGVVLLGIGFQMWDIRVELASNDYRHEPDYWADLGDRIGRGHNIIALTQDYGYRILYYGWLPVMNWPETKQIAYRELRSDSPFDFNSWFDENTQDIDYFLVTRIKDFNRQSQLNNMLTRHYEIIDQGDGFILFDLTSALP
jgi:hypothetical protein